VLAQSLPLAVRRLRVATVLAVVAAGFAVQELRGYVSFAGLGLLVAVYTAGAYGNSRRRWTAGLATAGYLALSVGLHRLGSHNRVADYAAFYLALLFLWMAGSWVRTNRQTEVARRQAAADGARADERSRIARELHDVVTHHVTAMVVQSNAGAFLPATQVPESLAVISSTGRRALAELRDLLQVLDPTRSAPRDRLPGLSELDELIAQTQAAGQPVSLVSSGIPFPMGAGRELTAYRVVQEALTNALKYASGSPTVIRLDYGSTVLGISVTTSTSSLSAVVGGSGRGLAGLRERVELFGGELSAGPQPGGEFTVSARIPGGEPA
jgi:signal transduction histidine kinase